MQGFKNCNIYVEGKGIVKTSLKVENGRIAYIGDVKEEGMIELDKDLFVVPGFVDKHIHGANNSDSMYPTLEDIRNISKTIAKEGVTSYLPTTMTCTKEEISAALVNIKNYMANMNTEGAQVLGIHLEGPFINPLFKGAQTAENIVKCDVELFKMYQKMSGDNIRQVTFAYEEDGAELCKYLAKNNIVASLGHTNATGAQVKRAVKDGATSVTHTYNAMLRLQHREAGTVGGALICDELYCELICDLVHVCKEAIEVLYRCKGKDKLILVTDAMEAKHLPNGIFKLGGQDVYVEGSHATLKDGTLAGSTLQMNTAIKNITKVLNIDLLEAVDFATINPAKLLKIDSQKGSIKVGKDADFVVIDKDLNVYMTINRGNIIYKC